VNLTKQPATIQSHTTREHFQDQENIMKDQLKTMHTFKGVKHLKTHHSLSWILRLCQYIYYTLTYLKTVHTRTKTNMTTDKEKNNKTLLWTSLKAVQGEPLRMKTGRSMSLSTNGRSVSTYSFTGKTLQPTSMLKPSSTQGYNSKTTSKTKHLQDTAKVRTTTHTKPPKTTHSPTNKAKDQLRPARARPGRISFS